MRKRRKDGDVVPASLEVLSETRCIRTDAERLGSVVVAENQQTQG